PLSPPAPMVLGPQGPGRVGRRQAISKEDHNLIEIMIFFLYFYNFYVYLRLTARKGFATL
ncbi:hypothetical protein, partial [Paenibacillus farraposensis]|uniref:hypothetical protein n=1 Tax=Paenibacillus farraposensis TaxID=2807095 RepID=UPI001E523601